METKNIMIVGVGGQGSLLASKLLGHLLMEQGYDVKVSEVHGMSQRGGSVVTYVRYGDKVNTPVIDKGEADFIVSFELLEAARWLSYLKPDGQIVTSTQQIDPMPVITGAAQYPEDLVEKMHAAGVLTEAAESILTEADIADFTAAGADIILLPAPGTVPGITMEYARTLISCAHRHGALTITAIGTSQEGADTDTIRRIALMCKMAGTDIHHIGDTGYTGMALAENIMAYSIAVRGIRHTYHRMAISVER